MLNPRLLSLLMYAMLLQAPVRPNEGGTITGTVKGTDGKPAIGVRVTARAKPDSLDEFQQGIAMSSIAQTDQDGRYRLESVPPGRYYIAAGNIDLPTYYPGTLDVASGTVLQVTPGAEKTAINFTLADLSFSLAGMAGLAPGYVVPVQIEVEGGGKVPVFSPNGLAMLEVRRLGGFTGSTVPLNSLSVTVPFPITPADYEVRVLNAPEGYRVKSLVHGSTNLLTGSIQISAADIPLNNPGILTLLNSTQQLLAAFATTNRIASRTSPNSVVITLDAISTPPLSGVRITGQVVPGARSVWLADAPGFLYADGTFELRGVQPGPHVILASNESQVAAQSAASIVVGDRDIDGIQLDPLPVLPRDVPPQPASNHPVGTVPLAAIRGRLVSATTQQPVRGVVNIVGWTTMVSYSVNQDGRFEISKLLPGSYNLTASIFDYYTVNETVVIGETDSEVVLRARPAY